MAECKHCATRSHVYDAACNQCTVRHLARSIPSATMSAFAAIQESEGIEVAKAYRERVKAEYRLDRAPGGLYGAGE